MKRFISICLAIILVFSMVSLVYAEPRIEVTNEDGSVSFLSDFKDTQGHWAHDVIQKWAEYELIAGYQGNFSPNNPIKRGDLCLILDRMLGLTTKSYNFFYDLPSDKYYTEAVLKCVAAGLVNGTSSTTVNPEGYATREQIAAIMCRLLSLDSTGWRNVRKFNDDTQIGSWAKDSVYTMRKFGYMNGNGANNVNPKSNITRAEFVQVMNNIAGSYVPRNDRSGQGTAFKSDFSSNLMTSRNIELVNSTIARDLILTPATSSINLSSTVISGRLFVMGRSNIELLNTTIGQVYLKEGKSNVSGITDKISEVYVAQYASESSLDKIPTKLVLEPGVRVRIEDTMYENTSTYNKIYYGIDIKADIAAEQGFVVGGPKISNVQMSQGIDNVISLSNARVTANGSDIREIGVVWKSQYSDEDMEIPNYQNRDGIYKYWNTKIDELISFDVGSVSGVRTYRMYVKDSDGLYAYSEPFTFTAYGYSMNLKVYDNDYPQKIDVELVIQGSNLPNISNVRVTYGNSETFSENRQEISLSKYSNPDSEYQYDDSRYRRYVATIYVQPEYDTVTQQNVYNPPTHFGYVILFNTGERINRYPVLSNVVPEGVSPMGELKTGNPLFLNNGDIQIRNNTLTTRYVLPQEVGIVYKVSDTMNVGTPVADANGWKRISAYVNVGLGESTTYNSTISLKETTGYTCYAAYVKTSNGYWYGDMKYVSNNRFGDEGAYQIQNADILYADNSFFISMDMNKELSLDASLIINESKTYNLSSLECKKYKNSIYIKIPNMTFKNNDSIMLRVKGADNLNSNVFIVNLTNANRLSFVLSNKTNINNNYRYRFSVNTGNRIALNKVVILNSASTAVSEGDYIYIPNTVNLVNAEIQVKYTYYFLYPDVNFEITEVVALN